MVTTELSPLELALLGEVVSTITLTESVAGNIEGICHVSAKVHTSAELRQAPRWDAPYFVAVSYHVQEAGPYFAYIPFRGARASRDGVQIDVPAEFMDPSGAGIEVPTTAGHILRAHDEVGRGWPVRIREPRKTA